jgi:hypothetical protein
MAEINTTTNIEVIAQSDKERATGVRIIPALACMYPPAVKSDDLLLVDFDDREISTGGGLYLVEEIGRNGVSWMGCRRFDRHPDQTLIDIDGEGDWKPINLDAVGWRVAGHVQQVYKPSLDTANT